MASQPFQECLQHTQFKNWSLREYYFGESTNSTTVCDIHIGENQDWRENTFARIVYSTIATTRCAGLCCIEPCKEIVSKEWQVNHFKSACNTHNLKIGLCENLILANQPIQPLFTTYIVSKNKYLDKIVGQTGRVTKFNQWLQHTYFKKIVLHDTYVLENKSQMESILYLKSTTIETDTQFFFPPMRICIVCPPPTHPPTPIWMR